MVAKTTLVALTNHRVTPVSFKPVFSPQDGLNKIFEKEKNHGTLHLSLLTISCG